MCVSLIGGSCVIEVSFLPPSPAPYPSRLVLGPLVSDYSHQPNGNGYMGDVSKEPYGDFSQVCVDALN